MLSGRVAAWMGVGDVMSRSARTRTRDSGTPRAAKPEAVVGRVRVVSVDTKEYSREF